MYFVRWYCSNSVFKNWIILKPWGTHNNYARVDGTASGFPDRACTVAESDSGQLFTQYDLLKSAVAIPGT